MAKTTPKSARTSKQVLKERTKFEWILLILLLLLAYLLLATWYGWWPARNTSSNLGTAFYPTSKPAPGLTGAENSGSNSGSTGSGGSNNGSTSPGTNGANGSNGTSGGNGSNGTSGSNGNTTTNPSAPSSALLTFAGGINTGDSKQEVEGSANGLNQSCAIVANVSTVGKQEVCTYTEGDKIVTVTYLNDRVINASRSGF